MRKPYDQVRKQPASGFLHLEHDILKINTIYWHQSPIFDSAVHFLDMYELDKLFVEEFRPFDVAMTEQDKEEAHPIKTRE